MPLTTQNQTATAGTITVAGIAAHVFLQERGMMTILHRVLLGITILLIPSRDLFADEAQLEFFEKKIRPVLATYCYECHANDSKKLGGELLLDSRLGWQNGGDSGAAIQVGDPDQSLLIKAVRYTDEALKMPPKGRLPDSVIADLEHWVKTGAHDPRDQQSRPKSVTPWSEVMRQRSDWWSLHPVSHPVVPATIGDRHATSPIDHFIEASLSKKEMFPAPATDPQTFIRRLSLVLTGLPPTVEAVDRFVEACQKERSDEPLPPQAVETLVDSYLQSPHFGEQWARHWMDVVRFSETHGNEWNYEVHHAWRYRDYLIRAFNDDLPYDQFVREHIAGDLLPQPRWNEQEQFNESVIGTGFYRFGEVNHDDCISLRSIGYDLADNQLDTLTKAFQATTVACARCHNHKLDAISSEDYYALLAILRSSRNVSHCIDSPQVNAAPRQRLQALKNDLRQELAKVWHEEALQFPRYLAASLSVRTKQAAAQELASGLNPQRLEKWVAMLAAEKQPLEEPFELLRQLSAGEVPVSKEIPADAIQVSPSMPQIWKALREKVEKDHAERTAFNESKFEMFADFRTQTESGWMQGGQGLADPASGNGDFVVQPEGGAIVQSILPAGRFTHRLSSKLNGTLRSPVLPAGKRYISFQVLGQRSSALRLVSNHCQLNYANYRAMTSAELQWVTFAPPEDRESLRTYAELMTMFDNPKFPDQLAALGGDSGNYKLPWDKAAENPRSYFGVTQVVLHDGPETPQPSLAHLIPLVADQEKPDAVATAETVARQQASILTNLAARYTSRMSLAIDAFAADAASAQDVAWLDAMLKRELLTNQSAQATRCQALVNEYRQVDSQLVIPRVSVGISDGGPGIEQPVFHRGDCTRPGEPVPRRYLEVLAKSQAPFESSGSGRLELADRIASPTNPLTSRVMVNRIWHHLFGVGLARTVDDFGHVGEPPSHPDLLDYLANQFVDEGWSVKRMIRSLVLTKTFQASNRPSKRSQELDPQNRLLQHYTARRMEAESVRDTILAASGGLNPELYGPSIQPFREKEYADRRLFPGPLDGNGRRSVYTKNNLMEAPKFLGSFNFPGGKVVQGRRDVTNVPAQALALLNDPFVLQQAGVWSDRLLTRSTDSISTRIESMFRRAFGRLPDSEEQANCQQTIQEFAELYHVPSDQILASREIWRDLAHTLFNFNEMIFIP